MEIIHLVLGKANPERMNGVNKVVYELATRQALAGRQVTVWGITADVTHNYTERAFHTRLFEAAGIPFQLPKDLKNAVAALDPSTTILHIHGGWIPVFYSVAKVLAAFRINYVFTPHGAYNTVAMQKSAHIKRLYFTLFEQHLLHKAGTIQHIGESESKGLSQIYDGKNITLLPYGFESINQPNERLSMSGNDFVLGFVGRLDIYTKGLDLIVKAFAGIAAKHGDTKLWIVGDSKERPALEKMVQSLGITPGAVHLLGSKFGEEKIKLMQEMTAFIHASRNEGLPASILEAAALGLPCIVTEATNIGREIKQYNAGICVADENIEQLQEAIETVYNAWKTNQLAAYSRQGKRMVEERYSWSTLLNRYDDMYQSLLHQEVIVS